MIGGKWEGTVTELMEEMSSRLEIDKRADKKSFPTYSGKLGTRLNTIIENLSERGIKIVGNKEGSSRIRRIYDTRVYKENPFKKETPFDPNKVVPMYRDTQTQLPLSRQTQKDGDSPEIKDLTFPCNQCGHYQGNDLCGQTDGLADPENCPFSDVELKRCWPQ